MEPINIMMIGGRRCGKTSVLAAMQNCFEQVMEKSDLTITINDFTTLDVLEEKFREAEDFFRERNKKNRTFVPDVNPSLDIATYSFKIGNKGKNSEIILNFVDYPGEFLEKSQYGEVIFELLKNSRILVIAIDTPHLMEEDQKFDDRRNLEKRVTEMIKRSGFADKDKGPALVLFVPLKCERYRNDNRMGEVTGQVRKSYDSLIKYLQTSKEINMAITPIFTLGGAAFSRFERDENSEIKINSRSGLPEKAIYYFPDMNKDRPEPQYCEQPLLYILSFVITQAANLKANRSLLELLIGGIWDWINEFPTLDDYVKQLKIVESRKESRLDGYYIYGGKNK